MTQVRSRYLLHHRKHILIVCNYKVGFSSLNSGIINRELDFDTDIKTAFELKEAIQKTGAISKYRKFLIVRDPVKRYLSFYFNWIVNKEHDFVDAQGNTNHGYRILREVASAKEFQEFVKLSREHRATEEALHFYTRHLPALFMNDGHVQPQHFIYSEANLEVDFFQGVLPIEKLSTFISKEFEIKLPIRNKTKATKSELSSNYVKQVCGEVYSRDYLDFGKAIELDVGTKG